MAAHQQCHQVLGRLVVHTSEALLLLDVRRQKVLHHVWRDVLLLLLLLQLLAHCDVRCGQTPRALLRSESRPGTTHPTTPTKVSLGQPQQLCLVCRPKVEVVRPQTSHRAHRQVLGRWAAHRGVPVVTESSLGEGVVDLLCGRRAV